MILGQPTLLPTLGHIIASAHLSKQYRSRKSPRAMVPQIVMKVRISEMSDIGTFVRRATLFRMPMRRPCLC